MIKKYFSTLFDSNYLIKGLTMIKSLSEFCEDFKIFVLCIDNETKFFLEKINISQIICISLVDIENEALLKAKNNRTKTEYCWTLASYFTWHVMKTFKDINLITYLDADLLFYSSVEPIFQEIGNSSIAIIEHRFSPAFKNLEINGRFCVEWNSFRRDYEGLKCLNTWKEQCLDWCYYKLEDKRMGDQKYLDEWPYKYNNCHIIQDLGAGIAPWNFSRYDIKKENSTIKISGASLIFYHFHQFQILNNNKFFRLGKIYTAYKREPESIYKIYEEKILNSLMEIRKIDKLFSSGIKKNNNLVREKISYFLPRKIKNLIRRFI